MSFREISVNELNINPVTIFSDGWALLTAGSKDSFNAMTVSWGAMGEIWGKASMFVFVRPQRYTHDFCESSDLFTVSCFNGNNKDELTFFGRNSGRDCDKFSQTGLTAVSDGDHVYCKEAEYVFICRKTAKTVLQPENFTDSSIASFYPSNDYHDIYVGEIVKILVKE